MERAGLAGALNPGSLPPPVASMRLPELPMCRLAAARNFRDKPKPSLYSRWKNKSDDQATIARAAGEQREKGPKI
jgi:hypothetical protein